MTASSSNGSATGGLIVAIDGPAGAGKSTVASRLARRFGLLNLESGAMYRAFALKALRAGVALYDGDALGTLAAETVIELEPSAESNRVLLDGEDVTALLRATNVSDAASRVSVFPPVRERMVSLQQLMGVRGGVVMEGRDIGTVVFPHAQVKIFLEASAAARARRRFDQLGPQPEQTMEEVLRQIEARDLRDCTRADSPLKPASDAVLLDSTALTLEQVVQATIAIVEKKI
jgi:cytidylate kinase